MVGTFWQLKPLQCDGANLLETQSAKKLLVLLFLKWFKFVGGQSRQVTCHFLKLAYIYCWRFFLLVEG
jgi:hypothetical protein